MLLLYRPKHLRLLIDLNLRPREVPSARDIIAVLSQLFIIEQDIGYGEKSTFTPPSLYIHGWIRTFIIAEQEIDQIV